MRYSRTELKIRFPRRWIFDEDDVEVFLMSIDGVHCRIQEPQHPTLSQDPSYYSHKFNGPALHYELGLSIHKSCLVWINGLFIASNCS